MPFVQMRPAQWLRATLQSASTAHALLFEPSVHVPSYEPGRLMQFLEVHCSWRLHAAPFCPLEQDLGTLTLATHANDAQSASCTQSDPSPRVVQIPVASPG